MNYQEYKAKPYTVPLWQFLRCIHEYTTLVKIYVVLGNAWIEERKNGHRIHDFWLTENAFQRTPDSKGIDKFPEVDRLLEYYADVPLWNVTAEFTREPFYDNHYDYKNMKIPGHHMTSCIVARCYFKDLRDAYYREKNDIQRKKKREYNRQRKEQKKNGQ